jgi:hypothetical protein
VGSEREGEPSPKHPDIYTSKWWRPVLGRCGMGQRGDIVNAHEARHHSNGSAWTVIAVKSLTQRPNGWVFLCFADMLCPR